MLHDLTQTKESHGWDEVVSSPTHIPPFLQWLAASLFFWVPINKAPFNVHFVLLLIVVVVFYVSKASFRHHFKPLGFLKHPLVWLGLGLFTLYVASLTYTIAPTDKALDQLYGHRFLLYPLFLLPLLTYEEIRKKAFWFLFSACFLTLCLSFLNFFSLTPSTIQHALRMTEPGFYGLGSVFQDYLRQSIQMSWLLGFCLVVADQKNASIKLTWFLRIVAVFVLINIFFVLQGRTAYLVTIALLCFYGYQHLRLKGCLLSLGMLFIVAFGAYQSSSVFRNRVNMTIEQIQNPQAKTEDQSAISNPRPLMWKLVLDNFTDHPILGYGIRSYPEVANTKPSQLDNQAKTLTDPHNQFLFVLIELGLVGLSLMIWVLWHLWRMAIAQENKVNKTLMQQMLIIFVVAGLTNVHFNMGQPYQFFICLLCLTFATKATTPPRQIKT
jgi:O-antigen ligase